VKNTKSPIIKVVKIDNLFLNILIVQVRPIQFTGIETWEITGQYRANTPMHQHTNTEVQHVYSTNTKEKQSGVTVSADSMSLLLLLSSSSSTFSLLSFGCAIFTYPGM